MADSAQCRACMKHSPILDMYELSLGIRDRFEKCTSIPVSKFAVNPMGGNFIKSSSRSPRTTPCPSRSALDAGNVVRTGKSFAISARRAINGSEKD